MTDIELTEYWKKSALSDLATMEHLFQSKDYAWALFLGHLYIEKLIKAIYVKNNSKDAPRSHDLLRLASEAKLILDTKQAEILDIITTFNINVRYPDYKMAFIKKCTEEYSNNMGLTIKEIAEWLLKQI